VQKKSYHITAGKLSKFDRHFFDAAESFTCIGNGSLGGKASGLAFIRETISQNFEAAEFPEIAVTVPTLTVITTDYFDLFMSQNNLYDVINSDLRDDQIALAFQKGSLPAEMIGDLRSLISRVTTPLAIRSSSLLEDAIYEPFAGVYATKMIANNQHDIDARFHKLVEAIKFVYASTFFKGARNYIKITGHSIEEEKMAVIIQEVVGQRFGDRYYPHLSGVARSYNFYPIGHARPEDGIVNLALGLGKTIVDGGITWNYSPSYPRANPPYKNIKDLMRQTQTTFWAVNMGKPPSYDPIHETEYLVKGTLAESEVDGTIRFAASTYQPQNDRLVIGAGAAGLRLTTFAPIVAAGQIPLTNLLKKLLAMSETAIGHPVEMEFAMTLDSKRGLPARFGFLQVRPMVVCHEDVSIEDHEMMCDNNLLASEQVLGNGSLDNIKDIIYVRPESFAAKDTPKIAAEIEIANQRATDEGIPYLLIGFGRWGSSESWLGIPVEWSQISGAKVIVEAILPEMDVELSQGSHFFHNLTSLRVCYFSVPHTGKYKIDWNWLNQQPIIAETTYVRHIRLAEPLRIKVDGRRGRGVVERWMK
jgi:hypothetical protein